MAKDLIGTVSLIQVSAYPINVTDPHVRWNDVIALAMTNKLMQTGAAVANELTVCSILNVGKNIACFGLLHSFSQGNAVFVH